MSTQSKLRIYFGQKAKILEKMATTSYQQQTFDQNLNPMQSHSNLLPIPNSSNNNINIQMLVGSSNSGDFGLNSYVGVEDNSASPPIEPNEDEIKMIQERIQILKDVQHSSRLSGRFAH